MPPSTKTNPTGTIYEGWVTPPHGKPGRVTAGPEPTLVRAQLKGHAKPKHQLDLVMTKREIIETLQCPSTRATPSASAPDTSPPSTPPTPSRPSPKRAAASERKPANGPTRPSKSSRRHHPRRKSSKASTSRKRNA